MVYIIFEIKTKPGMNLEFLQSIGSIIVDLRKVKDCIGIDFLLHLERRLYKVIKYNAI